MTDTDWYRNSQWTPEAEAEFEARLARSRGQRNEYLRIQAWTLAETCKSECAQPAISLARRYLELLPKGLNAAQMHGVIAKAAITLGETALAIDAFRSAVACELDRPNVRGYHYIDFAWFVATRDLAAYYDEALAAMEKTMQKQDLIFPVNQYRYFAALALISSRKGDRQNARAMARNAMAAAAKERGPFWRLPGLGLVGRKQDANRTELKRLAE